MKTKLAIAWAAVLSVTVSGPALAQGQIRNWSLALSVRPRDGAWRWSFGDGTAEAGRVVAHTYTKPGTYTVKLEAAGVDGISGHKTFTVKVTGLVNTGFDLMHNRRAKEQSCCQ